MYDDEFLTRYMAKVTVAEDGCWRWLAKRTPKGYGQIKLRGQYVYAHRVIWEICYGPIPEGLTIDHLCRNRGCVNPDHLEPVTMRENLLRGETKAAANARRTHCTAGHPLDGTYLENGKPVRYCKTCANARERRRYHRRKLELG